jgi:hypothetical protein
MSAFVRYLPAAAELLPWLLNLATSGADLTFAILLVACSQANVKSKAPLESIFSSGPLIPTFANVPAAMGCECWNWTASLLARSLNMPEPVVHAAGLFVFVRVQAFENSFLKALCPKRLKRRLLALCRPLANQGEPT